jgi:hypothetical protein
MYIKQIDTIFLEAGTDPVTPKANADATDGRPGQSIDTQ